MDIDSKAQLVLIEVVHRVEVAQEDVAYEEEVSIPARKSAFVKEDVALVWR